jgi:hypothetical protein
VTTITADDLEAIRRQLTDDQLAHVGASWVAEAAERKRKGRIVAPLDADAETEAAFALLEPIEDRILHHEERSRALGIDDDIIGCFIAVELLGLGYSEEETVKLIAGDGTDWHPRTADERLVAAAADLLAMGMEPETVRAAFAARAALTGSEVS